MIYQGSGGHQGVQGCARGHQGSPGGSTLPPAAKRVIKTAKNGPKPRFKVSKVYPDPKRMVLIYFWGIWGLLDELQQQYLVKTSICQKPSLRKKNHTNKVPDHQVQFSNGLAFFHTCQGTQHVWKNAKKHNPLTKFGCDFVCINIYFSLFSKKIFKPL